jgi:TonB family protein
MVPGSVSGSAPGVRTRESELATSSVEQRTRTFNKPTRAAGTAGPSPGDVLRNRYVLHQCLADGSTCRLFRALDRRREAAGDADPWVVLKVVTVAAGGGTDADQRALDALRREAALSRGLDHPHLPRVLALDRDGPHGFLAMAWVEGDSLAAILDGRGSRPMTRVQALQILEGVGRALTHLHARGITHADVKPGNILVTAAGHATLIDLGVAVGPGTGDLPPARGLTPEYASPEVLAGAEPVPADDLFSLGCVAYRMLAGHRAFGDVTADQAAAAGSRPARPGQLSPAQWRALDRALAFTRADRQPDVATFLAQLRGGRDEVHATTEAPAPVHAPEPSGTPPGRRRFGVAAGALAALAVAIVATLWLSRTDEPPTGASRPEAGPPAAAAPRASLPRAAPTPPATAAPSSPVAPPAAVLQPAGAAPAPAAPAPRAPATTARRPATAAAPRPPSRPRPAELAGPPLPEPESPAATPAAPESPGAAIAAAAGTAGDGPAAAPTVPFSSLAVRRYAEPNYPRNAAARRLAGWVDVSFTVEASGRTRDVQVAGAEPAGVFEEAAVAAVRRWRFASREDDAAAGPVRTQVRVRFDPR